MMLAENKWGAAPVTVCDEDLRSAAMHFDLYLLVSRMHIDHHKGVGMSGAIACKGQRCNQGIVGTHLRHRPSRHSGARHRFIITVARQHIPATVWEGLKCAAGVRITTHPASAHLDAGSGNQPIDLCRIDALANLVDKLTIHLAPTRRCHPGVKLRFGSAQCVNAVLRQSPKKCCHSFL